MKRRVLERERAASGNKKEKYGGAARNREGTAACNKTTFMRGAAGSEEIFR